MTDVASSSTLDVVICTYNNAGMLDATLSALATQQSRGARWSCLVVDNNCTDGTPAVVEKHVRAGAIAGLRSVRESRQGLTPARLRGVRSSSAAWIAFVDDDCVLQRDWIANAVSFAERHPHIGAFGGRVLLDFVVKPPGYVRAFGYAFAEQDHGSAQGTVPFLVGAGLVVNRSALAACGWTDAPQLADRCGRRLVSGGDVEIVLRIASLGRELWYLPECELRHRIPPPRTSLRYLMAINHALGISQSLADALVWEGSSAGWIVMAARKLTRDFADLGRLTLSAARRKRSAAEVWIQAGFRIGQLQGLARLVRMSPRRRRELMGLARRIAHPGEQAPTRAA